MIIKSAIRSNESRLPKKGLPVSIKNDNGKSTFALYSEGDTFIGVALEDAYSYKDFDNSIKPNMISVCYGGVVNAIASEALIAGDIIIPSENGFKKSTDNNGVGIVIRGGSANNYIEILLKNV